MLNFKITLSLIIGTLKSLINLKFFLHISFLRKIPQLFIIRTSTFINFCETCHQYCFYVINIKNFQLHALLEPPRLFDFGKCSYLQVIRTPRLLETSSSLENMLLLEIIRYDFVPTLLKVT